MAETRVVHVKREKYDVYIGRNPNPEIGKYGNPFTHKSGTRADIIVATPEQAVSYCRKWLIDGAEFLISIGIKEGSDAFNELMERRRIILASLCQLKNKTLGCWCKYKPDAPCHGDIYVELVEKYCP